jgi:hypothetical protein
LTVRAPARQTNVRPAGQALPTLCLSAVEIHVETDTFRGRLAMYGSDEDFRQLQATADHFVYRVKGRSGDSQVLVVPLNEPVPENTQSLQIHDYQSAVARLIERQLLVRLPKLELRATKHGLERVRRNDDLVESAFKRLRRKRPASLAGIHKFHRTVFRVRHEFLPARGKAFMLAVEFRRHQEISPPVSELTARGLDLRGLEVFTREDDRRRWVGRIVSVADGRCLVDGDDGEVKVDAAVTWIEPSTESFTRLLEQVLGRETHQRLIDFEWEQRAEEICGTGYIERLEAVVAFLRNQGAIGVAPGLNVSFGGVVPLQRGGRNADATDLPQVEYCFSSDRTQVDQLPARGLERFGPIDRSSFDTKEPRLLVVCPAESQDAVDGFVRQLLDGTSDAAKGAFRLGLTGTYRLNRVHTRFAPIPLDGVQRGVGSRYVESLKAELGRQKAPDIVLVVIRDEDAFVEQDNPYLAAKALLLRNGIASQEVRVSKINSSKYDLPYILRDIAVATYAKLGGSPWTVRPTMPLSKEVVLGMAHAEFGSRYSTRTRYMGITTVFNSDGTYLLAAGTARCRYDDYPGELANSVKKTLLRLASDYAWSAGDVVRLVFHTTKPLTGKEVDMLADEAVGALGKEIQVQTAFLTIEQSHPYKVLAPHEKGNERFVELLSGGRGKAMVGTCAPKRGLMIDLGRHKRLLCVNGPALMKREGESIPHPLQIDLHQRSTYTDMGALVRQVFHFTGLSWRSMLPVTEPVTIYYPHLIARLLGRFTALPDWHDDLLDTRLHRSRWFL